ncbi:MAG TPA: hypothetical protein VH518_03455 [Tepidisphaeraceae bacterium]|jgi:hypothetical protein
MSQLSNTRVAMIVCVLGMALCVMADDKSPPRSAVDLLPVGSNWTGTEGGDQRKPDTHQARDFHCEFKVVERKDNTFAAEYFVNIAGTRHSLRLEGRVDDKGNIAAKATKVLKGAGWEPGIMDEIWSGGVRDKELIIQRTNDKNLVHTSKMTLDDEQDSGSRGNRRKKQQ